LNGFHRIRQYGLIANNARKENLALARELLQAAPVGFCRIGHPNGLLCAIFPDTVGLTQGYVTVS